MIKMDNEYEIKMAARIFLSGTRSLNESKENNMKNE
jgi:hypothetical protein|tara:strand:+ start:244 stop:351 length:108 start_codon:yes stop_codon:yes gene_type:complete